MTVVILRIIGALCWSTVLICMIPALRRTWTNKGLPTDPMKISYLFIALLIVLFNVYYLRYTMMQTFYIGLLIGNITTAIYVLSVARLAK